MAINEQDDIGMPNREDSSRTYFKLFETCKLYFQTLDDLAQINHLIQDFFPGQPKIVTGVNALALNAIEHGNLEIGYQFKAELLAESIWDKEIEKRLLMDQYKDRKADLVLTRKDNGTYIIITDQGKGFDWQKYLTIDPVRATQKYGRGIAIAKTLSFSKLSYNDVGNQAIAFVADEDDFKW